MLRRSLVGLPAATVSVFVLGWVCLGMAAGQREGVAGAKRPDETSKVSKTDPFEVPDGTVEELQKYIEGLNKIQPSSSLRPAVAELHRKRAAAQLKACEKILAAQPTPEQAQAAVRLKLAALAVLGRLGDETAQAQLDATVEQVEKLGLQEMVHDVQLAALENRCQQAEKMREPDYLELVERVKQFFSAGPIDAATAKLGVELASAAERSSRPALAVRAYRELGEILAANKDERGIAFAAPMLGAARRLDLVGKPFVLEAVTVAGRSLDWRKFRGKVVLIDFFATWCGPCREEIPNILRCYKTFRKRGFEVIAVSIDTDRKAIEDFLEKEKYPWTVLLDRNEARGTDKSLATYYGIFALPQMILVGKDGKVLALNVRGEQLGKKLEELLGPVEDASHPPQRTGEKH